MFYCLSESELFLFFRVVGSHRFRLEVPDGGDDQSADNRDASHQYENGMPAESIGKLAQRIACDEGAEITHETDNAPLDHSNKLDLGDCFFENVR